MIVYRDFPTKKIVLAQYLSILVGFQPLSPASSHYYYNRRCYHNFEQLNFICHRSDSLEMLILNLKLHPNISDASWSGHTLSNTSFVENIQAFVSLIIVLP